MGPNENNSNYHYQRLLDFDKRETFHFPTAIPTMNPSRRVLSFSARFQSSVACEEIRIPVPWGHVAGKWWGPQDKRPILTIHGWQDNSGSFDRLIPLLPRNVGYLAIDLPGHGLSSRLPAGMPYSSITDVISIKLIKEYFEWNRVSFLGHSMGALASYSYGFFHPRDVDFLIGIDPMQMDSKKITDQNRLVLLDRASIKTEPPSHPLEELARKLHIATNRSIDLDHCKCIIERNVSPSEEKPGCYFFSTDPRLWAFHLINWDGEFYRGAAKFVRFPVLLAITHGAKDYMGWKIFSLEEVMGDSNFFEGHKLEGKHHAHLNTPEMFTGLITEFMKKHDTGDRSWSFDMARIRQ